MKYLYFAKLVQSMHEYSWVMPYLPAVAMLPFNLWASMVVVAAATLWISAPLQ